MAQPAGSASPAALRGRQIDNGLFNGRTGRPRWHILDGGNAVTRIVRPNGAHRAPLRFYIGPGGTLEHGRILPGLFAAEQERQLYRMAIAQAGIRTVPREIV